MSPEQRADAVRVLQGTLRATMLQLQQAHEHEQEAVELLQRATAGRVEAQRSHVAILALIREVEGAGAMPDEVADEVPSAADPDAEGAVRTWRAGAVDWTEQDTQ